MLPRLTATAYLTALREGGSLPGLMEADDLGTYVVKFTGAGQGPRALVAEIVVGRLGQELGVRVPDLALIEVDPEIGRREPDEEVQDLVTTSAGLNLAMDFLPGSVGYDRGFAVPVSEASTVLWLDAYVANVDRSRRNTNLLIWHKSLWAIDHGACLRFHHAWGDPGRFAESGYDYGDHVLGGLGRPREVHAELAPLVTPELLTSILAEVPDGWLAPDPTRPDPLAPPDAASARERYVEFLTARWPRPIGGCGEHRRRWRRAAGRLAARRVPLGRREALVVTRRREPFQYAVLRAVPRIDRGEFINVGVIVYCQALGYLRAAVAVDDVRLRALAADVDVDAVRVSAEAIALACHEPVGTARENNGLATRFGMLTAPRSTVVQPSPVHAGVTRNPGQTLADLMSRLVGPARRV